MENEVKIKVPEGYEIDKENSTFECIRFKKLPDVRIYPSIRGITVETPQTSFIILDKEDLKTDFDSAFKLVKFYDYEATIPTREQWKIIHKHLDEINKFLRNEIEKECYWTSEKHDSPNSWFVIMSDGSSYHYSRSYASRVRPIINL